MLPLITLKPLHHRGQEVFLCQTNREGYDLVRKIKGVKWSQTNKCWYLPLNKESYTGLRKTLQGKADLNSTALKGYLEKRNQVTATLPPQPSKESSKAIVASPVWKLNKENTLALEKFIEQLKLKAYSASTIRTYRNEFLQLLQLLKNKKVDELSTEDLRRYMVYVMEKGLSENGAHSRLNAIKFYFEQVLKKEKFFWEIPRPKKPADLPKIFNQDEIAAILNTLKNEKHKTMLMVAYSAGLRVSEVVSIKTYEVDSRQMTILIKRSKGKKDRLVSLSPVLLVMLRKYALMYKPEKDGYLFEGAIKGNPYSTRSLQEVLQIAKKKAGIIKPGSIHCLRHSFATHLVDKGTDVTMIQKLLGHNDIKTTLRYLHTSNRDLLKIISPLDSLKLT